MLSNYQGRVDFFLGILRYISNFLRNLASAQSYKSLLNDNYLYFCGSIMLFLSCICYAFCVRLFIDASWSPAGNGLTSWLSFVMSNCEVVTFPLVSWIRCGAWLYRFLIFALFLTLNMIECTLS